MNTLFLFVTMLLIGYRISSYISRPVEKNGERRPNRLPTIRLKNLEVLPCFRIHYKDKTYWLHHWLYLSIITLGLFLAYDSFSHLLAVKGVALGGIIQGLQYPDRFKFRHPRLH